MFFSSSVMPPFFFIIIALNFNVNKKSSVK
nr:MAG TPA: hypothetical protein [Caudoviricetes sp.]